MKNFNLVYEHNIDNNIIKNNYINNLAKLNKDLAKFIISNILTINENLYAPQYRVITKCMKTIWSSKTIWISKKKFLK